MKLHSRVAHAGSLGPIDLAGFPLVAAGVEAKSRRIALQKKLNIAEQTQLSQTTIAISLIMVAP
jgi:hypothetical protein